MNAAVERAREKEIDEIKLNVKEINGSRLFQWCFRMSSFLMSVLMILIIFQFIHYFELLSEMPRKYFSL